MNNQKQLLAKPNRDCHSFFTERCLEQKSVNLIADNQAHSQWSTGVSEMRFQRKSRDSSKDESLVAHKEWVTILPNSALSRNR